MRILYLANIRLPTEKAHGIAILRACEAFIKAGVPTRLIVARRRNHLSQDVAAHYGLSTPIPIRRLPSIDLYGYMPDRLAFFLQAASFYLSLSIWMMWQSRDQIIYTRDPEIVFLSLLGFKVVYECHHIPRHRTLFFRVVKRASRIVVISQALKEAFVAVGFTKDDMLVAPSGVALDVFKVSVSKEDARRVLELPPDLYLAVYTGNFTTFGADKGIEDILQALVSVDSVLFVAVGGSEQDILHYRTRAEEAGVSGKVKLVGSSSQSILALYQRAADVLLMPFPDTPHYRHHMSPVKMFEYMASGRPIITTHLPTIREVLNEHNAFIVPPGDRKALAQMLREIQSNSTIGYLRAREAEKNVLRYTWDMRAKRVIDFICSA